MLLTGLSQFHLLTQRYLGDEELEERCRRVIRLPEACYREIELSPEEKSAAGGGLRRGEGYQQWEALSEEQVAEQVEYDLDSEDERLLDELRQEWKDESNDQLSKEESVTAGGIE